MTRQHAVRVGMLVLRGFVLFPAVLAFLALMAASAIGQNPVSFVDQPLVPDATAPGGPAFTLTVNGAGFVAGSVVNWNGSPRATTFVSSTKLTGHPCVRHCHGVHGLSHGGQPRPGRRRFQHSILLRRRG
jgi:hypothetical protein